MLVVSIPCLPLTADEMIFGCGESATGLNKVGQKVNSVCYRPTRSGNRPDVQAHSFLYEQSGIWYVHAYIRTRDL